MPGLDLLEDASIRADHAWIERLASEPPGLTLLRRFCESVIAGVIDTGM